MNEPITPPKAQCPACGSSEVSRLAKVWDHEYAVDRAVNYAHCLDCRTCYQVPMPDLQTLAGTYPEGYHSVGRGGLLVDIRYGMRLRRLRPLLQGDGAVLDFGCGDGSFLVHAARRETTPERHWIGYEIGATRQVSQLEGGKVTIVKGAVSDLMDILPSCRLITLNHVIEHLPDPPATLELLRQALIPGGSIEGQTPAAGSLEHQLFDRRWSGYHAPRHTVVFSKTGLQRVLERAGYEQVTVRGAFNPAGIAVSLASLGQPVEAAGRIRRGGLGWLCWLSLAGVLGPVDLLSGRPGIIDFSARRPHEGPA